MAPLPTRTRLADRVAFARVSEVALDSGNQVRILLTVPRSVFLDSFSSGLALKITAYLVR